MSDIHIRKRGKKWYYSFEAAHISGKRKRIERVGGATKREALEKGVQALSEYNNSGQYFEPVTISVSDFLDYYIENYSKLNDKYNTIQSYICSINNHLKPAFGSYRLASLCTAAIQQFVNSKYLSGLSVASIKTIIAPLSHAFEYAIDLNYVRYNPCTRIKYPPESAVKKKREVISLGEYNIIMQEMALHKPFDAAVMIGFYAGLRISETFALTWNDIDFDNRTISVNKQVVNRKVGTDCCSQESLSERGWCFQSTKTRTSNRVVTVSADVINALKRLKKDQQENRLRYGKHYYELHLKDEYDEKRQPIHRIINVNRNELCVWPAADMVFRHKNGKYLSPHSFKYPARIIHNKLGIEKFTYHSLRHSHATMLIQAGVSPKAVQGRLGHTSINTTFDKYVHNTYELEHQAVEAFDNIIKTAR